MSKSSKVVPFSSAILLLILSVGVSATSAPTAAPSISYKPTSIPTSSPTCSPTTYPTLQPTSVAPTSAPTPVTAAPTKKHKSKKGSPKNPKGKKGKKGKSAKSKKSRKCPKKAHKYTSPLLDTSQSANVFSGASDMNMVQQIQSASIHSPASASSSSTITTSHWGPIFAVVSMTVIGFVAL